MSARLDGVEKLHWFLKGARDPLTVFLSAAAVFCFTMWTSFPSAERIVTGVIWWGIGGAAAGLIYIVGLFTFLRPTYGALAKKEAYAQQALKSTRKSLQSTIDTLLQIQMKLLRLDGDSGVRISVYSVEHDEFVLIARRSKNPEHERRGRPSYPLQQGVIGDAWRSDSANYVSKATTRAEWNAECVEQGFTEEEAAALTMMARSTAAIRIDTFAGDKVGMLVIESEDKEQLTKATITNVRRSAAFQGLIAIISESHSQFPRVLERENEREGKPNPTPILDEAVWKNPPRNGR